MKKEHSLNLSIETDIALYSCLECNKYFSSEYKLARHQKEVHSEDPDRKFGCKICGKWFKRKEHCLRHIRAKHFSIKYTCSICGKRFVEQSRMLPHFLTAHPIEAEEACKGIGGLRNLTCPSCNYCFPNKLAYAAHMLAGDCRKEEESDWNDSYCDESFLTIAKEQAKHKLCTEGYKIHSGRQVSFEECLESGEMHAELSELWFGSSYDTEMEEQEQQSSFTTNTAIYYPFGSLDSTEEKGIEQKVDYDVSAFLSF